MRVKFFYDPFYYFYAANTDMRATGCELGGAWGDLHMRAVRGIIGRGGRVTIPADQRRALGLMDGDEVVIGVHNGAIRVQSPGMALKRARALMKRKAHESAEEAE